MFQQIQKEITCFEYEPCWKSLTSRFCKMRQDSARFGKIRHNNKIIGTTMIIVIHPGEWPQEIPPSPMDPMEESPLPRAPLRGLPGRIPWETPGDLLGDPLGFISSREEQ